MQCRQAAYPLKYLSSWRHRMSGTGTGRGITKDTRHFLEYNMMQAWPVNQKPIF